MSDEDVEMRCLRDHNRKLQVDLDQARAKLRSIHAEVQATPEREDELGPNAYVALREELLKLSGE